MATFSFWYNPVIFPFVSHLRVRVTAFTGMLTAILNSSGWDGFSPNGSYAARENFALPYIGPTEDSQFFHKSLSR